MWTSADNFGLEGSRQEVGITNAYKHMLNCIVNQMAKGFSVFSDRLGKESGVCSR